MTTPSLPYNDFGTWLNGRFPYKVQKISIDAGFSCPNRDGRLSTGGCIFCDNKTFNPSYCRTTDSITDQLHAGKDFFSRKYPDMRYLAYFQAYSNTYAPIETLRQRYEEALQVDGVVGLVIATRPDCISNEILDYLAELSSRTFVIVEYGIESTNDATLERINRHHNYLCAREAIEKTASRGILVGAHVILGLPDEDIAACWQQAKTISDLPLNFLKIHQLQIIKGTPLATLFAQHPFHVFSVEEYLECVIGYIRRLRKNLILERFVSQSPSELLIAPRWGLKNYEFTNLLVKKMRQMGASQGDLLTP